MGCGCKKRNQPVSNQSVNIQLTEGSSSTPPQEITIMEQQLDQIIKKVEEINNQNEEENTEGQ
jgi:TolA-binding protein